MGRAREKIELGATTSSFDEVEIVETDLVQDLRCRDEGTVVRCEIDRTHGGSDIFQREFDSVHLNGVETYTTLVADNDWDFYADSMTAYCGHTHVEQDIPEIERTEKEKLVCVDSDLLNE